MPIKWFGNLFKSKLDREMDRRFEEVGIVVSRHAKQLVGIQYPPASSPGNPPHRRTGAFRQSITYEVRKRSGQPAVRIYSTSPYGDFLNDGTSRMAARPWRKPAYRQTVGQVKKILLAPIK
jgi:HK97 gp10 family phage protein